MKEHTADRLWRELDKKRDEMRADLERGDFSVESIAKRQLELVDLMQEIVRAFTSWGR